MAEQDPETLYDRGEQGAMAAREHRRLADGSRENPSCPGEDGKSKCERFKFKAQQAMVCSGKRRREVWRTVAQLGFRDEHDQPDMHGSSEREAFDLQNKGTRGRLLRLTTKDKACSLGLTQLASASRKHEWTCMPFQRLFECFVSKIRYESY